MTTQINVTREHVVTQLAVLKVIKDLVSAQYENTRKDTREHIKPGGREPAELPDGTRLGSVTMTEGRVTAKVTDDRALTAWAEKKAPSEITTTVRDGYKTKLLDRAKKDGGAFDPDTGEQIPGITVENGDPYPTFKPAAGAVEAVAAAWARGDLSGYGPTAIEAGDS